MNTSLPSWLDSTPITSKESPAPTTTTTSQSSSGTDLMTYREIQFTNLLPTALDRLSLGHTLPDICDDDPRGISPAEFIRWILKDKERFVQYEEALKIGAEINFSTVLSVARGENSMNDVNRDKVIVEATFKHMAFANPKRFGKEAGLPLTGGNQPITINIGDVVSPYAKPKDDVISVDISDVEVKE